jgi:hypothetical protein
MPQLGKRFGSGIEESLSPEYSELALELYVHICVYIETDEIYFTLFLCFRVKRISLRSNTACSS